MHSSTVYEQVDHRPAEAPTSGKHCMTSWPDSTVTHTTGGCLQQGVKDMRNQGRIRSTGRKSIHNSNTWLVMGGTRLNMDACRPEQGAGCRPDMMHLLQDGNSVPPTRTAHRNIHTMAGIGKDDVAEHTTDSVHSNDGCLAAPSMICVNGWPASSAFLTNWWHSSDMPV